MPRKPRPFTLIELLTVIAIIAILAGILLPAVNKVREKAKGTRARTEIRTLEMAIKQYQQQYGYLPCAATNDGDDTSTDNLNTPYGDQISYATLIEILSAPGTVSDQGGREITFLEAQSGGDYVDPWDEEGEHNGEYRVVLDSDYSGDVTVPYDGGTTVNSAVAVWSCGKDETDDDGNPDQDLVSWED